LGVLGPKIHTILAISPTVLVYKRPSHVTHGEYSVLIRLRPIKATTRAHKHVNKM